jgi:arylsulfate sulfotransferase
MRKINFNIYLIITILIFWGCKKDEISDLKTTINNYEKINSLISFENLILKENDNDNLITDIIQNGNKYQLTYEDQKQIEISQGIISKIEIDSINWKTKILLSNDTTIIANFLGNSITINPNQIKLNPYYYAPLTALIEFETPVNGYFQIKVKGQDGEISDLNSKSQTYGTKHSINLFGLYPTYLNTIDLVFTNKSGIERKKITLKIQTNELPAELPSFEIIKQYDLPNSNKMFLSELRNLVKMYPFIVDCYGKIRWYYTGATATYKYAIQKLKNGNICYGSANENDIVEINMFGQLLNKWSVSPLYYNVHHDVFEMPNGNFLVTVDKVGEITHEDYIIEIDRKTHKITNEWDLNKVLPKRFTLNATDTNDWFHNNAVIYDNSDNSIIVSGQRQGIVKLSWDNKLIWILSSPKGWGRYDSYLLKSNQASFEWCFGQHSPVLLPNKNLLLFDNGFGREYSNIKKYSRAVEYKINENNKTIEEIWQYGKERELELYSPIISNVDYNNENNRIMVTGSLDFELNYIDSLNIAMKWKNLPTKAKILEIKGNMPLFEMLIKSELQTGSIYRAKQINIY